MAFARIQYLATRIVSMDFKKMRHTAHLVKARTGRATVPILVDIIRCGLKHQAGYSDYLVFEMYLLNEQQRATYITRGRNNQYVRTLNPQEHWHLLEDKVDFLKRMDGFHGRDWLDLRTASYEDWTQFCATHKKIVVKPLSGTCGKDVEFLETDNCDYKTLYDQLRENQQYLVEDFIVQHPGIACINPYSVNTLRLVTIRNNHGAHVVFSSIRIGNNKTQVDNLNSGGMAAIVDMKTGCISTPGADKDGQAYEEHPITHKKLKGSAIPFYNESIAMVKQAAQRLPELRYIAWDVAVTEKGPLLIEANHFPGHDIYQFQMHLGPDRIGLAPRFNNVIAGGVVE